jgi:hypothetical protein
MRLRQANEPICLSGDILSLIIVGRNAALRDQRVSQSKAAARYPAASLLYFL